MILIFRPKPFYLFPTIHYFIYDLWKDDEISQNELKPDVEYWIKVCNKNGNWYRLFSDCSGEIITNGYRTSFDYPLK